MTFNSEILPKWIKIGNIAVTNATALFFAAIHFICLSKLSSGERFYLNLLISLLGGLIGWVLGNIASPATKDEKETFSDLGTIIATFLSGYVVSKLDRFLELSLFGGDKIDQGSWISVCFFITALIIVSVTVFLNRFYTLKRE